MRMEFAPREEIAQFNHYAASVESGVQDILSIFDFFDPKEYSDSLNRFHGLLTEAVEVSRQVSNSLRSVTNDMPDDQLNDLFQEGSVHLLRVASEIHESLSQLSEDTKSSSSMFTDTGTPEPHFTRYKNSRRAPK